VARVRTRVNPLVAELLALKVDILVAIGTEAPLDER